MTTYILRLLTLAALLLIAACETVKEPTPQPEATPTPTKEVKTVIQRPSSAPISNPSKSDIIFAQGSLKALGYRIGQVDGIWGKRSATALQEFEKKNNIPSAYGKLSLLNLATLRSTNVVIPANSYSEPQKSDGIARLLNSPTPSPSSPELIIVDKTYSILVKPNPYSEILTKIEAGTGLYVLSLQSGWYEVETLSDQRGFIEE